MPISPDYQRMNSGGPKTHGWPRAVIDLDTDLLARLETKREQMSNAAGWDMPLADVAWAALVVGLQED